MPKRLFRSASIVFSSFRAKSVNPAVKKMATWFLILLCGIGGGIMIIAAIMGG